MNTEDLIFLWIAISVVATIVLVIVYYQAPPTWQPIRKTWDWLRTPARRKKEEEAQRQLYLARPCAHCGGVAFIYEERKTWKDMIFQASVWIFIISPLTCGIGLLFVPLAFCGGKLWQRCRDCAAERPGF